jgi:L-2-hydroxyglutarate oxidase LhgO
MTVFRIDAIVAGAGVVGLAIGRRLALTGLETLILEQESAIGTQTSARNSEVIHAGLYYPTGSLKARTCVAGRQMLYRYCAERGVRTSTCGKLMVAVAEPQMGRLRAIWDQATANGVTGLKWLTAEEAHRLEPEVQCFGAFLSSATGIIDCHGLLLALQGDFEAAGGVIAFKSRIAGAELSTDGILVRVDGDDATEITTGIFVNAAGHGAPRIATAITGFPQACVPRQWYAKGNYFSLVGRQPFSHLVYPLPNEAGLGTHATIDMQGRCRFGPDVEWVESDQDFVVDPSRAEGFYSAIRSFWPALTDGALMPDYAGIRPKLHDRGTSAPDFRVDGPEFHGIPGLVNLFGIESPGLTASLALAEEVARKLALPVGADETAEVSQPLNAG